MVCDWHEAHRAPSHIHGFGRLGQHGCQLGNHGLLGRCRPVWGYAIRHRTAIRRQPIGDRQSRVDIHPAVPAEFELPHRALKTASVNPTEPTACHVCLSTKQAPS